MDKRAAASWRGSIFLRRLRLVAVATKRLQVVRVEGLAALVPWLNVIHFYGGGQMAACGAQPAKGFRCQDHAPHALPSSCV